MGNGKDVLLPQGMQRRTSSESRADILRSFETAVQAGAVLATTQTCVQTEKGAIILYIPSSHFSFNFTSSVCFPVSISVSGSEWAHKSAREG